MRWYRAEIIGRGFYFDGGGQLPETKLIHFDFQAESDEEAVRKAEKFAKSPETRKEFWLTDCNPRMSVMAFVGNPPNEERAYLAN